LLAALLIATACGRGSEPSLRRAAEAWDAKDYQLAAQEYERYIERNPAGAESLAARFRLANVYNFNLQRYEQAVIHYRELLRQDPSDANALAARERLAEVLGELGRTYEAVGEYEKMNPQEGGERRRIRLRIADLYFNQNNYSQALAEYEKVIEGAGYDEMVEQALMREAAVYNARNQYQQSLGVYQRVVSQTMNSEARRRAMYGVADSHAGLFQFDDAIRALREIKDESERQNVTARITELERQKREAARASSGLKQ
jgi:tetratricopeptide (TPR) repeat protein